MNLQKTKALAQQSTKKQSQGSQSGALVKIFSESVGLSKRAKCRKWREWKESMRILESHSDKPNSEGRKNKHMMKIQSQGSQSESQVKMGSESGGFSEISNCREHVGWDEVMRMLEAHSKGHITLSNEQITVLKAVSRGESVFLTGSAGTGKSYLIDFVVKILKELHGPGSVFVTASTGIAACHLNGMTLHSFAGAPPCAVTQEQQLLRKIQTSQEQANKPFKQAKNKS
jgi:DNA replication protein DnaC